MLSNLRKVIKLVISGARMIQSSSVNMGSILKCLAQKAFLPAHSNPSLHQYLFLLSLFPLFLLKSRPEKLFPLTYPMFNLIVQSHAFLFIPILTSLSNAPSLLPNWIILITPNSSYLHLSPHSHFDYIMMPNCFP